MNWSMAPDGMAEAAEKVIHRLMENQHEAYWVGGCVRDELMGRPVHDMDITTSALPQEVVALFSRTVPTGLQHGTITVLEGGHAFEVTTYRTESGYADHRRPEQVVFVRDVKEDLRRRDFTMNAIACGTDDVLTDPFGGAEDVNRRIVRCVGEAEERFEEDALRMLRCVRFASVLDFSVAKNTWRGLLRQRDKLAHIAVERLRAELERIVEGPHPLRGLGMLARSGLLPRGKAPFPWTDADLAAAAARIAGIGELESAHLRWALLLHALGRSAAEADTLLRAWTFPGTTVTAVVRVLRVREDWTAALEAAPAGNPGAVEALRRHWIAAVLAHGSAAAEGWLALLEALPSAGSAVAPGGYGNASGTALGTALSGAVPPAADPPPSSVQSLGSLSPAAFRRPESFPETARQWMAQMPLGTLAELAVSGRDLSSALDKRPGPWLGELLERLLQAAAAGDLPNHKEALLQEAKRMVGYEQH